MSQLDSDQNTSNSPSGSRSTLQQAARRVAIARFRVPYALVCFAMCIGPHCHMHRSLLPSMPLAAGLPSCSLGRKLLVGSCGCAEHVRGGRWQGQRMYQGAEGGSEEPAACRVTGTDTQDAFGTRVQTDRQKD